jgi:hypothetical protein
MISDRIGHAHRRVEKTIQIGNFSGERFRAVSVFDGNSKVDAMQRKCS